jgi:hypothetical protein
MAKAAIFYDDLIAGATLTASSEAGTLGANNLKNYQPGRKWRAEGTSETLIADFGVTSFIPSVLLLRHNLTASATIRIRISENSDLSAPVYDVTFYAWPGLLGLDEDALDGSTPYIGLDGAPVTALYEPTRFQSLYILSDVTDALAVTVNNGSYAGRYLGMTIEDSDNIAGYVEAGIWRAGQYIQTAYDISYNREFGVIDPSLREKSYGQETWVSGRNKLRTASFSYEYLSESEALIDFDNLGIVAGSSKPVVFAPFLENSFRNVVGMIYGLMMTAPRIRQVRKRYDQYSYAVDITIEQML